MDQERGRQSSLASGCWNQDISDLKAAMLRTLAIRGLSRPTRLSVLPRPDCIGHQWCAFIRGSLQGPREVCRSAAVLIRSCRTVLGTCDENAWINCVLVCVGLWKTQLVTFQDLSSIGPMRQLDVVGVTSRMSGSTAAAGTRIGWTRIDADRGVNLTGRRWRAVGERSPSIVRVSYAIPRRAARAVSGRHPRSTPRVNLADGSSFSTVSTRLASCFRM